jgi:hypothetical protein
LGGWDHGSRPAKEKSSWDSISTNCWHMKRLKSGRLWFRVRLSKKFARPHLNGKKMDMVLNTCYSSYSGKHKYEDHGSGWPGQKVRLYLTKRAGGMAQVVECLPHKNEALSLNTSAAKNKSEQGDYWLVLNMGKGIKASGRQRSKNPSEIPGGSTPRLTCMATKQIAFERLQWETRFLGRQGSWWGVAMWEVSLKEKVEEGMHQEGLRNRT